MIQIESVSAPFTSPRIAFQAAAALGRADAMGLLPPDQWIETLDMPSFRKLMKHIRDAGIGRNLQFESGGPASSEPGLELQLLNLNMALEESPVPEFEWTTFG